MKITKRILAVLLLAALLVSCMLLSVSAEDPFSAAGIDDIEDIMEYYDLEDYLADNYENDGWSTDLYVGSASSLVPDPRNAANTVLKVADKNNKYSTSSVTDVLVVSFNIYYEAEMNGEYRVDLKFLDANAVESLTYTTMFSVNAGKGAFQYSLWNPVLNNGEGTFVLTDFAGLTPEAATWYNVVIFFNPAENSYNFKISSDNGESWVASESYSLGNAEKVSCFELKSYAKNRGDKVSLYLDNVEAYAGSFERNPAEKNAITAETLIDLEALYLTDGVTPETKVRIAQVIDQIVNVHSYVPAPETAELEKVNAIIAKAAEYINLAFAEEVVARASAIDTTIGYSARVEYVEESEYFSTAIPADEELATAAGLSANPELVAAVIEARAAFASELLECETVAEQTKSFVALMKTYNAESKDYDGYLKNFYESVTDFAVIISSPLVGSSNIIKSGS